MPLISNRVTFIERRGLRQSVGDLIREILRGAKSSKVNIEGWLVDFVDREGEIERIVRSGATREIIGMVS